MGNFQGLLKTAFHLQVLFKPVRTPLKKPVNYQLFWKKSLIPFHFFLTSLTEIEITDLDFYFILFSRLFSLTMATLDISELDQGFMKYGVETIPVYVTFDIFAHAMTLTLKQGIWNFHSAHWHEIFLELDQELGNMERTQHYTCDLWPHILTLTLKQGIKPLLCTLS